MRFKIAKKVILFLCLLLVLYGSMYILPYIIFNIATRTVKTQYISFTHPQKAYFGRKGLVYSSFNILYDSNYNLFVGELLIDYRSLLHIDKVMRIKAYNINFFLKDKPDIFNIGDFNLDLDFIIDKENNISIRRSILKGDYFSGSLIGTIKVDNTIDVQSLWHVSPAVLMKISNLNMPFFGNDKRYPLKVKIKGELRKPLIEFESDLFKFTLNKKDKN